MLDSKCSATPPSLRAITDCHAIGISRNLLHEINFHCASYPSQIATAHSPYLVLQIAPRDHFLARVAIWQIYCDKKVTY
jgi:hypothetical protein